MSEIKVAEENPIYDSRNDCNAIVETATNTIVIGSNATVIPTTIVAIGHSSFYGRNIKKIEIPNSVTCIDSYAFEECIALEKFEVPKSVTKIGQFVLRDCHNLRELSVEEGNPFFDSRNGCNAICATGTSHFESAEDAVHSENSIIQGCINTVIPSSISSIEQCAFWGTGIEQIVIPSYCKEIEPYAFANCQKLVSVEFEEGGSEIIADHAFEGCFHLKSIVIPHSTREVGRYAPDFGDASPCSRVRLLV